MYFTYTSRPDLFIFSGTACRNLAGTLIELKYVDRAKLAKEAPAYDYIMQDRIARVAISLFTFLCGGVIVCTPPRNGSDSLRDGFVLGGHTQKISIHSVGALAVRSPGGCG
jgi:hypothetical protein